jgi:hypothetical protein
MSCARVFIAIGAVPERLRLEEEKAVMRIR